MKSSRSIDLGVRAGRLLSMKEGEPREALDQFVAVKDGVIVEVTKFRPAHRAASRKFIDGSGGALLPGFVNGHTHLPMALFRGVAEDLSFHDWLFERILPLEAELVSREFVRDGLELALLECIRFGVTCVNEMYFFAGEEAAVIDRVGLRATIAQCMASFPLPEDKALGTDKLAITDKLRAKYAGHARIRIGLGPHAPYSCDDELLRSVKDYAARTGAPVHIHLSETAREVAESREKFGMSPVARLEKLGFLRPGVTCAHCVHLDGPDRELFQRTGASVVHNPDSNAKLGAGVASVTDYLRRGIDVSLGSDGSASNNDLSLFGAMDLCTKLQKLHAPSITDFSALDALRIATRGGAAALGMLAEIGTVEVGKRADLALVSLGFPHMQPVNDLVAQLVFSAQGCEVSATICDGKVLYHAGKFSTLDEKKIYAKAERWRKKIRRVLEDRK